MFIFAILRSSKVPDTSAAPCLGRPCKLFAKKFSRLIGPDCLILASDWSVWDAILESYVLQGEGWQCFIEILFCKSIEEFIAELLKLSKIIFAILVQILQIIDMLIHLEIVIN